MKKIQIVDDDVHIITALKRVLHADSWCVDVYSSVTDALAALEENHYDVIIADYLMPILDGVQYLAWAKVKSPGSTRLMLSAFSDKETLLEAINIAEVFRFITKPWKNDELIETVRQAYIHSTATALVQKLPNKHPLLVNDVVQQLERLEPGITRVKFDDDGALILDKQPFTPL
jgi:DNA-binding NtrC family response regulator